MLVKCVSLLPEEVTCTVCQKTFKRKDYLKQHMKTHAPERDVYRCPREGCGRTYTTVFNLQSHILSLHEEKRPFVCEHAGCGKTFAMKVSVSHSRLVCSCPTCRSSRLTRPVPSENGELIRNVEPQVPTLTRLGQKPWG